MNIKEVAALAGLERSNINYYERVGMFWVKEDEDGNVQYQMEHVEKLRNIKLLRGLDFSIEEILKIESGGILLLDAVKNHKEMLEKNNLPQYLINICQQIYDSRAVFTNLDGMKYLGYLEKAIAQAGDTFRNIDQDKVPDVFHPWRRFFARILDLNLYYDIWAIVLIFVFRINLLSRNSLEAFLDFCMAILIMLFVEPILLKHFKTTLGKFIFGLKVEGTDGKNLTYVEGLVRTKDVIFYGLGLNIPFYSWYRLWKCYSMCKEEEIMPWDLYVSYSMKDKKKYRIVVYIFGMICIYFILDTSVLMGELPPNKGQMTVIEFAENFNFLSDYCNIDMGDKHLNVWGKWAEDPKKNLISVNLNTFRIPEFQYEVEDGYIKGISFELELINNKDWIDSCSLQMSLATLSFVGAKKDINLYSSIRKDMVNTIAENMFEDFEFTQSGVTVSCNVEKRGYDMTVGDMLVPEQDGKDNYYSIKFSMSQ